MTAEIIILNRQAVALAADSAVTTVPTRSTDLKIYHGKKLFQLSSADPVAVMFFGTAALGGIPWETAVHEYRKNNSDTQYDSLEEHAEAFIASLPDLIEHIPRQVQYDFVKNIAYWTLQDISEQFDSIPISRRASKASVRDRTMKIIQSEIDRVAKSPGYDTHTAIELEEEINDAIPDWGGFVRDELSKVPLNSRIVEQLRDLVRGRLSSTFGNPWSSGVVVAGFGHRELFPGFSEYRVDGVVADRVRSIHYHSDQIGEDYGAIVVPFAQRDVVMTFIDGIHPGYPREVQSIVDETLRKQNNYILRTVLSNLAPAERRRIRYRMTRMRKATIDHFVVGLREFLKREGSGPIMSVVEVLPGKDLAEMAETLVNLTSFQRRFTPVPETVGGPIDVAVISRGDGFKWMRQKP